MVIKHIKILAVYLICWFQQVSIFEHTADVVKQNTQCSHVYLQYSLLWLGVLSVETDAQIELVLAWRHPSTSYPVLKGNSDICKSKLLFWNFAPNSDVENVATTRIDRRGVLSNQSDKGGLLVR